MRASIGALVVSLVAAAAVTIAPPTAGARTASVATAPTWTPPPGALPDAPSAAYIVLEPSRGWSGSTITATNDRSDILVLQLERSVMVDISGDEDLNFRFGLPNPGVVEPGFITYQVGDTRSFGFSCGGDDGEGWVDITAAQVVGGALTHLEFTFEHVCPSDIGASVIRGAIVWDAAAPPGTPNPIAIPGDLWEPPSGSMPETGNAGYVERGLSEPVAASGTDVAGYDVTLDPYDQRGDEWQFRVGSGSTAFRGTIEAGRHDDELRVGLYAGLLDPGVNGVTGGLDLSQGSNAFDSCPSWFAIDELTRANGHIQHIAFRFEHGCSGSVAHGAVRWTAKPEITSLSPDHGISRGGTVVSIEGIDIVDISGVTVGGVPATLVREVNQAVRFKTPQLPVGNHEVRITVAGGVAVGTGDTGFTATPDTPMAPGSVTVTPGVASALVEWQPPEEIGAGTITGVRLDLYRWSNQYGAPPERTQLVGPGDTVALWGELWPGYRYRFAVTYLSSIGPGVTTTSAEYQLADLVIEPFDGVPTLVTQQYVDFVGRGPSSAERSAAVDALRRGKTTPSAYVASMRNRPEWGGVRAPLTRLYSSYFDRLPDSGGLTFWAKKLRSGTSLAQVSATFAASSEFNRSYGKLSNGAFVDLIYRNVLHRAADPSGRTYWIRKLNAGAARGSVMTSFSESSEHVRTMLPVVDAVLLYTGMLRRMPTTAELPAAPGASVRSLLATAATSPSGAEALAEQLLRSPAYASRF